MANEIEVGFVAACDWINRRDMNLTSYDKSGDYCIASDDDVRELVAVIIQACKAKIDA